MSIAQGQPKYRFAGHFNPGNMAGISYAPKVITVVKDLSGETNETILSVPAGTFVKQVMAICTETCSATDVTVEVGLDGNLDEFIDLTDFSMETVGNFATNIGSSNATSPNGLYIAAADNINLQVTGSTVTDGQVLVILEYYETGDMSGTGQVHLSL